MNSYFDQVNLAQLRYSDLLNEAEIERRLRQARTVRSGYLLTLLQNALAQSRTWFAPRRVALTGRESNGVEASNTQATCA